MRKIINRCCLLLLILNGCSSEKITSISIISNQVNIGVEESITLTVTHSPSALPAPGYLWVSSSPNIVTVNNGIITGINVGTAVIKVTSLSSKSIISECTVIVKMRGTLDFPYYINNVQDLILMRDRINNENVKYGNKAYKLAADLDFANENYWEPIGKSEITPFKGSFDGNGKIIKNIKIGTSNTIVSMLYAGLFGYINGGKVSNLDIRWSYINTDFYAGGIAGKIINGTIIYNCVTDGDVISQISGGIVGSISDGEISNCHSSGNISSACDKLSEKGSIGGGISAEVSGGIISNCYSTGNVSAETFTGGIIGDGFNKTIISNCYSTGNVTAEGYAGGIIGRFYGTIINNCYSTGNIFSFGYSGGISGYSAKVIFNSYSTGNVSSDAASGGIGGGGAVYNCYSTGKISTSFDTDLTSRAGGISSEAQEIYNCYSISEVKSYSKNTAFGVSYAGGIAGYVYKSITNCIALNSSVTADHVILSYVFPAKIANLDSFFTKSDNNYSLNTMVVKKGNTTVSHFSTKTDGINLTANPVDLLNAYVNANPTINGVALSKWKVQTGVNNGYPIFQ